MWAELQELKDPRITFRGDEVQDPVASEEVWKRSSYSPDRLDSQSSMSQEKSVQDYIMA